MCLVLFQHHDCFVLLLCLNSYPKYLHTESLLIRSHTLLSAGSKIFQLQKNNTFYCDLLQLLIGFESGTVALWDLKSKKADYRYTHDEVTENHSSGYCFVVIFIGYMRMNVIFALGTFNVATLKRITVYIYTCNCICMTILQSK